MNEFVDLPKRKKRSEKKAEPLYIYVFLLKFMSIM